MIGKEDKAMAKDTAAPELDSTMDDGMEDSEAAATPEIAPDDAGGDGETAVADETVEEPGDPMAVLAAEVAATKEQLLRALAETENVRRRAVIDREEARKYAITAFARELLSMADNLRRALESVPEEKARDEALAGVVSGIEMTEREFLATLERHDIRRIDPLGEKFDHNFHQAVFEVADSDAPSGTVVQVIQAGYVIADRLLRPAMVGVAKGAKTEVPVGVDTEA